MKRFCALRASPFGQMYMSVQQHLVEARVGVGLLEPLERLPLHKEAEQVTSESPLEPMTSSTPSTASEPEQPEPLELQLLPPAVSHIESHSATFSWTPLSKIPSGLVAVYAIELQQLESLDSTPNTNWLCVYKGEEGSCKVDDLKSGRRYAARLVSSVNALHAEESVGVEVRVRSAEHIFFQTPATVPSAIQPPSLSQRARNSLKLKWNVPEDPGGPFKELVYVLQISPAPLGLEDQRAHMGFVEVYRGPERSFKVTKLQPGVRYTSRVQAVNPLGEGPFSLCSAYTTQATVPAAPEPPTVQAAASNALTLQWVPPPDNGSPIVGYSLERDDGMGGDFGHCYVGPNTWHTVKNLKPGTAYRFRLRADNDEGRSLWSTTATLTTGAAPPDSPVALQVVTPLATSATLAWSAPEHDYGSRIVAYQVELQAISRAAVACMGSAWMKIFEGEQRACTINSLCPGCSYSVRVRARNSAGWGTWAVPVALTTAVDVPEVPLSLQPTGCSAKTIIISWAPPRHDGGARVLKYRMEMASAACHCHMCPQAAAVAPPPPQLAPSLPHGPPGLRYPVQPLPAGPGSPSALVQPVLCMAQQTMVVYESEHVGAEVRNLRPASRYIFRLQAENAQGPGPWTDWVAGMTAPDVPLAPVPPEVTGVGSGALILNWKPPGEQGAPVTHYTIEVAPLPSMPNSCLPGPAGIIADERLIAGLCFRVCYQGPDTTCEVRNLEPKCAYALRLCGHCDVGAGPWSACTAAITSHAVPTCPTSVSAQSASSCKIVLCWMPPERDNGASVMSYTVDMAQAPRSTPNRAGGGAVSWTQLYMGPSCACAAEGLAPAQTYQFRVRAANVAGCGPYSPVVTATTLSTPPSAPGKPVIVSRAANNVRTRWDEPQHSYGAVVTTYKLEGALAGTEEWAVMYEGSERTVRVSNLRPATKYLLRVAATNAAGEGPFSECESVTTAMMAPLPPTGVLAAEVTTGDALLANSAITVSAAAINATSSSPADGVRGTETVPSLAVTWQEPQVEALRASVMGYEVEARPKPGSDAAGLPGGGIVKMTLAGRRCEARVEGVAPGCTYSVRVRSVGIDGTGHSGWSEEASVTVQPRPDVDTASVCSSAAGVSAAVTASSTAPRKSSAAAKRAAKRQQAAAAAAASSAFPAGAIVAASARAPSTSGDEGAASSSNPRGRNKAGSGATVRRPTAAPGAALPRPRKASLLVRIGESSRFSESVFFYCFGANWRRDAWKTLKYIGKFFLAMIVLAVVISVIWAGAARQ